MFSGENIKEIKEKSEASVVVSQNNARFPGTNERVISVRGSHDSIKSCISLIQEKIRNDKPPENAKGSRTENEKRKQCCKLVVSDNTLGRIIGTFDKNNVRISKYYLNTEFNIFCLFRYRSSLRISYLQHMKIFQCSFI